MRYLKPWWKRPKEKVIPYQGGRCKQCGGMLLWARGPGEKPKENGEDQVHCVECGATFKEKEVDNRLCRKCGSLLTSTNGHCCGMQWWCKGCHRYVEDGSGLCDECGQRGFCQRCGSLKTREGYCPHLCEDRCERCGRFFCDGDCSEDDSVWADVRMHKV